MGAFESVTITACLQGTNRRLVEEVQKQTEVGGTSDRKKE